MNSSTNKMLILLSRPNKPNEGELQNYMLIYLDFKKNYCKTAMINRGIYIEKTRDIKSQHLTKRVKRNSNQYSSDF